MPRSLTAFLWVWLVAGLSSGVAIAIWQPSGDAKWMLGAVAVIPCGLVISALVEWAAHLFMSLPGLKQGTRYFEARAAGKRFSPARAAWYGFAAILGFVVVVLIAALVGRMVD